MLADIFEEACRVLEALASVEISYVEAILHVTLKRVAVKGPCDWQKDVVPRWAAGALFATIVAIIALHSVEADIIRR
jgi:hypothetical protein